MTGWRTRMLETRLVATPNLKPRWQHLKLPWRQRLFSLRC